MENTKTELQKLKNLKNWCKRHIKKQKGYYGDAGAFDDLIYLDAWKVIDKINELIKEDQHYAQRFGYAPF